MASQNPRLTVCADCDRLVGQLRGVVDLLREVREIAATGQNHARRRIIDRIDAALAPPVGQSETKAAPDA